MSSYQFRYPPQRGFKGKILDNYLAKGFFRARHCLFTVNYQFIGNEGMPVFWLRLKVNEVNESGSAKVIRKDCNRFKVTYKPAIINDEINELFEQYSMMIDFETSPTSWDFLHEYSFHDPFNSSLVEVRDKERLIAVGYFDRGTNTIAAILHFYHPDYKKYSLGKYLILKEMDYAREHKNQYYYLGYIALNYPKFDYKLFPDIDALEVFLPVEKEWKPYKEYDKVYLEKYFSENIKDFQ